MQNQTSSCWDYTPRECLVRKPYRHTRGSTGCRWGLLCASLHILQNISLVPSPPTYSLFPVAAEKRLFVRHKHSCFFLPDPPGLKACRDKMSYCLELPLSFRMLVQAFLLHTVSTRLSGKSAHSSEKF